MSEKEPTFRQLIKDPNKMRQWLLDKQDEMINFMVKHLDSKELTLKQKLKLMTTIDKMIRTRQRMERHMQRSLKRRKSKYDRLWTP